MNLSVVQLALARPPANGEPIDLFEVETLAGGVTIASQLVTIESGNSSVVVGLPRGSTNHTAVYRYRAHNINGWGEFSELFISGTQVTFEPSAPNRPSLVAPTLGPRSFNVSFELPTTSANPQALGFL